MGLSQPHIEGRLGRVYVARETTFGTYVRPSATSALKSKTCAFTPSVELINRRDSSQTGSTTQTILGRRSAQWTLSGHVIPSGTAGTPPDVHDLLLAWFGTYTNTPSTSDAYTIADSQTARGSVSISHEGNSIHAEAGMGSWVEQFKLSYTGTSLPEFSFEGGARDYIHTGYSLLDGGISGGASTLVVDDVNQYTVGSVISIGTSNNSGGSPPGHEVTAINTSTRTLTVTPTVTGAQSDNAVVAPYVPTETTAGTVVSHIYASATLTGQMSGGSATLPVVSFEIMGKNNFKVHDDEAGTQLVTDLTPGWRDITGTITFRARRDQLIRVGNWWRAPTTTRDLQVVIGTTAGSILTVDANQIRVENGKVEYPEADEAMITLAFYNMGSSGADELSMTFT